MISRITEGKIVTGPESQGVLGLATDSIAELIKRHASEATVEDLEDLLARQEKFLSAVSHDLRSPLTIAKMCADMIGSQSENPQTCRALALRISKAIMRADRMIKDLLDANRLQAGLGLPLRIAPTDLQQLLQVTVDEIAMVYPGRCTFENGETLQGFWDPHAIRRALENLIFNAIKYGDPQAPASVFVTTLGSRIRIVVHNFGEPIPAIELNELFSWHSRTSSAEQSGISGWGLGLMLVKGIAEGHGGSVTVESSQVQGTKFTIELPLDARRSHGHNLI